MLHPRARKPVLTSSDNSCVTELGRGARVANQKPQSLLLSPRFSDFS